MKELFQLVDFAMTDSGSVNIYRTRKTNYHGGGVLVDQGIAQEINKRDFLVCSLN